MCVGKNRWEIKNFSQNVVLSTCMEDDLYIKLSVISKTLRTKKYTLFSDMQKKMGKQFFIILI